MALSMPVSRMVRELTAAEFNAYREFYGRHPWDAPALAVQAYGSRRTRRVSDEEAASLLRERFLG